MSALPKHASLVQLRRLLRKLDRAHTSDESNCPACRLQRLALRLVTIVPTTAIVHLLAGCPSLREIDLIGSGFTHLEDFRAGEYFRAGEDGTFNQVVDDLISALVAHPQVRVTMSACDDLYRYLEGTAAHD
jgi:hypothetical protein